VRPLLRFVQDKHIDEMEVVHLRTELARLFPEEAAEAVVPVQEPAVQIEFLGLSSGRVRFRGEYAREWESQAARMLAFILASHPGGLRREQIVEMLWPDVTSDKGSGRFYPTLHRLRAALAPDIVVQENGLFALNPAYSFRYDLLEFRKLVTASAAADDETAQRARTRAISLYRTHFLEVCEGEWAELIREETRRDLLNLLLSEAAYQGKAGALGTSENLYRRALDNNPLDERAHRGLIWCRARANDRTGAIHQYQSCQQLLERDLDADVSAATLEVYRGVLAGRTSAAPPA
jgi:two-component SAPR family response regulator